MKKIGFILAFALFITFGFAQNTPKIMDHEVVLKDGKLQPWTEYNNVLKWNILIINREKTNQIEIRNK